MKNIINEFKKYNESLNKSEKTISSYALEIELFVKEYNLNSIEDLKILNEVEFVDKWVENMNKKGIAVSTINKKKNAISVFCNYLVYKNIIESNKFKELGSFKNDSVKVDIYSDEDTEQIISYIENKIDENKFERHIDKDVYFTNLVAIKLMNSCALRVNELCSIQLNDIDLNAKRIEIRGKGGKGEITRFNKLNNKMVEMINKYLEIRNKIEIKKENEQYLFISAISKSKITTAGIRKFIKKVLEELNIKISSPCHGFRHYRASELISKGANVKSVSLYLGHSSEKTTERYYIRPMEKTMEDLSEL